MSLFSLVIFFFPPDFGSLVTVHKREGGGRVGGQTQRYASVTQEKAQMKITDAMDAEPFSRIRLICVFFLVLHSFSVITVDARYSATITFPTQKSCDSQLSSNFQL
jgi:hypothetical protein